MNLNVAHFAGDKAVNMNLFSRVLMLEKRNSISHVPIQVMFQNENETDEKLASRANLMHHDVQSPCIIVKFLNQESKIYELITGSL